MKTLAGVLSSGEGSCPVPSAHDKVHEAHYFIHQLIENYHYPHPFRYYLSAFLSAARSITLMLQKETAHRHGFAEWVFPGPWSAWRKGWEHALEAAQLDGIHFHDLRHTFASWTMQAGASLPELQRLLGHATLAMTMRYAHLAPEHLRAAVARLDDVLAGGNRAEEMVDSTPSRVTA